MGFWNWLSGRPSKNGFAKTYMRALRQAGDTREMQYDAAEFCIRFSGDGGNGSVANLCNVYNDYVAVPPARRAECLSSYVRAALSYLKEIPAEFTDAQADLRPKLWARAMIERVVLQAQLTADKTPEIPYLEIGQHLVLVLVYDLPESTRSISQPDLDTWGVTFYEAMEIAKQNLAGSPPEMIASIGDRAYAIMTGDSYDASRVASLDLLRSHKVQGDVWAMAPSRDQFFFTGAEDRQGMEIVVALAEKAADATRPLSPFPVQLRDDEWVDWELTKDCSFYDTLQLRQLQYWSTEYHDQKTLLEAIHEKQGRDIFVASFEVAGKDGVRFSYCAWPNGIETLLPKTEMVGLMGSPEDEDPVFVSWESLTAVVGDLLQPTEYYPPRFRVTEFPNDEQLRQLRRG